MLDNEITKKDDKLKAANNRGDTTATFAIITNAAENAFVDFLKSGQRGNNVLKVSGPCQLATATTTEPDSMY